MNNLKAHWDKAFEAPLERLGWYESEPQPAWDLLQAYAEKDQRIHLAGAGRSLLVKILWEEGYQNLLLSDISPQALSLLNADNPDIPSDYFQEQDLSKVWHLAEEEHFDIWLDRAVLHFLTDEADRKQYFDNIQQNLKVGGRVILGQFAKNGAEKCCGLTVQQYDTPSYQASLGSNFKLLEELDYTYYNPKGDPRPYVYAVFERI